MSSQKKTVQDFCSARGISLDGIYEDRASGAKWDHRSRPALHELLKEVFTGNINAIVLETGCRLSPFGIDVYKSLFKYYACELIVINKFIDDEYYQAEQSDDISVILNQAKIDRIPKK